MRTRTHRILAVFSIYFAAGQALAAPDITITPSGAATVVSSTEHNQGQGNWDIELRTTRTDGPTDIRIEMPGEEFIWNLLVHLPDAAEDTSLHLHGEAGPADPIPTVHKVDYTYDTIDEQDQRARLVIENLRCDVLVVRAGEGLVLRAHEITLARVGQINGAIELNQSRDAAGQLNVDAVLARLEVLGDVLGRNHAAPGARSPITVHGPIEFMQVDGNLGLPELPMALRPARLQELIVGGDVNGLISTMSTQGDDAGFVQSIRVVGSMRGTDFADQTGLENNVLWTSRIGGLNVSDQGIEVFTDLVGDITVENTVERRIRVHGDFDSEMTIGDRVFDDPATADEIRIDGDMSGSIDIPQGIVDPNIGIRIGGSMLGDITVGGDLASDVSIGDMLIGTILIDEPQGLKSQIIVNTNDTEPMSNYNESWFGDVVVDTIVLGAATPPPGTAPRYHLLSTDLGGGAVGLARFDYHAVESDPPRGAKLTSAVSYVELVFYGPVDLVENDPVNPSVIVERAPAQVILPWGCSSPCDPGCGSMMDWTDVSDQYTATVSGRIVTVTGLFDNGHRYRVRSPESTGDRIVCLGVSGEPTVRLHAPNPVAGCTDDNYIFSVLPVMPLDLSGNGVVDGDDIVVWAETPTDVDESETADIVDLIILSDAANE